MPWTSSENDVLFLRAKNWAKQFNALLEERNRLLILYNYEVNGSPNFQDTEIATVQELIALFTEVMTPVNNLVNNGTVTQKDRLGYLTPFLTEL